MAGAGKNGNGKSADLSDKTVFTTGEAAEVCRVSQQTIIRCFDSGRLNGFRVPGSRFRRIPRDELIRFMRTNDIPLDALGGGDAEERTKVLVVDDDPSIIELFRDALGRDGRFEVQTASTGYDAGLLTASFEPDIVLLDYMLPDINGNIVCERLRSTPAHAETKVILISGVVRQEEIDGLMAAGADAFVRKPFDIAELIEQIGELVGA